MTPGIQIGGGIFIKYRVSCGYCMHSRTVLSQDFGVVTLCNKAYILENEDGTVTSSYRRTEDKKAFHDKYSVAPNTYCEEHFVPVSERYELS